MGNLLFGELRSAENSESGSGVLAIMEEDLDGDAILIRDGASEDDSLGDSTEFGGFFVLLNLLVLGFVGFFLFVLIKYCIIRWNRRGGYENLDNGEENDIEEELLF